MAADSPQPAAASASPPPTADPQDPLPESNWKWRRIFVFLFGLIATVGVGVVLGMLYWIAERQLEGRQSVQTTLATIEALYNLGWWLIFLNIVDRTLYLIAPSAEQAGKWLATISAWKGGISTASAARSIGADGSEASASQQAGPSANRPTAPAPATPTAPSPPAAAVEPLPEYAR